MQGPFITMRDQGQRPAERETVFGSVVEKHPDDRGSHCRTVARRHDAAGRDAHRHADTRAHCRQADSPWQAAEPSEQCTTKSADASIRVRRMPGQALRDQGRLLRVVRHESGQPQQPEPIHGSEAPGDRTCRHALAREAQSVAQRDTQKRTGEPVGVGRGRLGRNRGATSDQCNSFRYLRSSS